MDRHHVAVPTVTDAAWRMARVALLVVLATFVAPDRLHDSSAASSVALSGPNGQTSARSSLRESARSKARTVHAQAPALEAYVRIDRWPDRVAGGRSAIDDPVGLDVAADGRVFIADRGVGGVLTMLPDGTFLPPFGTVGSGPGGMGAVGKLVLDEPADRLYVLDTGGQRVVIFALDGSYVGAWEDLDGASIAVGPDGRVYVAEKQTNTVVVVDGAGTRLFSFGGHGTEEGRFTLMSDLSVSADGATLAIGDLNETRVQLFDLRADGADIRKIYNLQHPKYGTSGFGPPFNQCRAGVVHALGGDTIWVGDGSGACRIEPRAFEHTIATSAGGGTICKPTVRVPLIRPALGQFYAVAAYDPNYGPCYSTRGGKDTSLPTTAAVVRYREAGLAQVDAIFLSAVNARADGGLVAPRHLSVPAPERVFVLDSTRTARYFQPDGTVIDTLGLTTRRSVGSTRRLRVDRADGAATTDALFGYYIKEHRGKRAGREDDRATPTASAAEPTPVESPTPMPTPQIRLTPGPRGPDPGGAQWIEDEHGIGFFRTTTTVEYGQQIQVIDPVWTQRFSTQSRERNEDLGRDNANHLKLVDLAFRDVNDTVYALVYERAPVTRKDDPHLLLLAAGGSPRFTRWDLPDDTSSTYAINPYEDLSVGPDGRVLVLDDHRDLVIVFAADGSSLPTISVADDVRAIAGGTRGHLFGLRESGYVERYEPDGRVSARFDGRPFAATDPQTLSGIAADEVGRVYVADEQGSVVAVFEPAPPGSDALPVPSDATCVLRGDKTAAPDDLALGEHTTVQLELDGFCGIGESPSDIMIVTLFYPPNGVPDNAGDTIRELRRLVSRIDMDKHRVGIVGYFRDSRVEIEPTHDRADLLAEIPRIARRWPPSCFIRNDRPSCGFGAKPYPVLREGMKLAARTLGPPSERRRVMVVYHAFYCNRDLAYRDGDCRPWPNAAIAAGDIRDDGIQIIVHDGNRTGWRGYRFDGSTYEADAQPLSSSDADVTFDWAGLQHRMVRYHFPGALAINLNLIDTLPANMRLVPASISAGGSAAGADVSWSQAALPYGRSAFALDVEPQQIGRWPTNVRAEATFTDGWGAPGRIVFPVPFVTVREAPPTPTPTPAPTVEPTPAPTQATPTAGPPPKPLFLPLAMRGHCLPGTLRFDVALVLDSSSSMTGAKLDAATAAVGTFLDLLDLAPGADAAALVTFDDAPRVIHDLSSDPASLRTALAIIDTRPGTRIDRGLAAAIDLLRAVPSSTRRKPMVVLLSDGRQDDPAPVITEGERARAAGIDVYTIGLGDDVDDALLVRIAASPAHAFRAPTAADLRAIYEEVGRTIPCR